MLPGLGCTSGTRILYRGERARLREQGLRDTSPSILSDTEAGNPNVATGRMRWKSGSFSLAKVNAGQREPWRLESRHSKARRRIWRPTPSCGVAATFRLCIYLEKTHEATRP